jgi:hypothetical protein
MTPREAEKCFLELYRKLGGYFQIIKRSATLNPFMTLFLLGMNIVFRSEYLSMKKKTRVVFQKIQTNYQPSAKPFTKTASAEL